MSAKEAKARIKINKLLEAAGWRFFDDENGSANIQVEANVKITKKQFDDFGENFEKVKNGFIDFLLLDEHGKPFIVLEAKSEDKDPLVGKEQARAYAKSNFVKYVILSNGNIHYFWNIYKGNPQIILSFPTYESVRESKALNADPSRLYNEEITPDYIAVVREPRYVEAPEYKNPDTRAQYLKDRGLRMMRKYQVNAIKALQQSVREGNQRFLFEMATGTGKTLTSAAVIRLFLRSGNANRVLFLVDRIELENQAKKNFINYLKPDYETVVFKEHTEDWRKADIVVSTVQTLAYNNKYKTVFKPTDFSLIIADESHRSISGNSRAVFEYFIGYKLGLTATPKDYLKNVDTDDLAANDPRAWERRQLLDTYRTFGCESGEPTFRYSLIDGVNDPDGPYLVNPTVVDARTDITTQLLADEGYAVLRSGDEQDEDEEETFFARDFEKKFFSDETNKVFVKTFMDNALRDPLTGEIGKGIVFCVSRKHAAKITQLLNIYADKMFPDMYYSDFAMQITSDVQNAQEFRQNIKTVIGNMNTLRGLFLPYLKSRYVEFMLERLDVDYDVVTDNFNDFVFDNSLSICDLDYLCHLGVKNLQESNETLRTNYQSTRNVHCAFIEYCNDNDGIALPDGYPSLRNEKYLFYRYKHHAKDYIENELGINEYRCVKDGGEFPVYECPECGVEQLAYDADTHRYHCFACDENFTDGDLEFCERCGSLMRRNGEPSICDNCIEDMMRD